MSENSAAICRLCLESGEQMQNLFNPDENLVKMVEEFTGLEILQESSFPSNVCRACRAHIDTLNNFKKTCLESEKALRDGLVIFEIQIIDDEVKSEKQLNEAAATQDVIKSKPNPKHNVRGNRVDDTQNSKVNEKTAVEPRIESSHEGNSPPDDESNSKPKLRRKKWDARLTPCHICGKLYARQTIGYHLNMHSGNRPYVCPIKDCAKAFTSPTNLASHHKMCHTDHFRFACDVCGRSFKVKTTFDIHRSYHFDPELPCSVCGKLLRHPRAIKRHMMSHTGERPHPCNKCTKSFQTKYTLRIHQRVHTKEKPFTCAICGRSFSYRCVLRTHMASSHPEESES